MSDIQDGQRIGVGEVELWVRRTGSGQPVLQIHGAGFGHYNLDPATAILSTRFECIDFDMRGYGYSDRPYQEYDMMVWADDAAALLETLGFDSAHVHGTSMGGMIALALAAAHPSRVRSVVVNCAAAKLGRSGQLIFQNWIDLAGRDGMSSRTLAELIAWQALSREFVAGPNGEDSINMIQEILEQSNDVEVFTAACQAMIDMDLRPLVPRIEAPTLVIGGSEDIMTPWDQGPDAAGQQWIVDNLRNGYRYVIQGSNHSTIFDNTEEHCHAVASFFDRWSD